MPSIVDEKGAGVVVEVVVRGSAAISSELVWIYRLLSAPPFLYEISGSFMPQTCSVSVYHFVLFLQHIFILLSLFLY